MKRTKEFRREKEVLSKKRLDKIIKDCSSYICPYWKSYSHEGVIKERSKSEYKKFLKKEASVKARNLEVGNFGNYKKSFDIKWNLY